MTVDFWGIRFYHVSTASGIRFLRSRAGSGSGGRGAPDGRAAGEGACAADFEGRAAALAGGVLAAVIAAAGRQAQGQGKGQQQRKKLLQSNGDHIFYLTPSASSTAVIGGVANPLTGSVDTPRRDNVFQMCFVDPDQGAYSAQYISDNGLGSKIAVIYKNDDVYSTGIYDSFAAKAAELNLEIVSTTTFTTDSQTDVAVLLLVLADKGLGALVLRVGVEGGQQHHALGQGRVKALHGEDAVHAVHPLQLIEKAAPPLFCHTTDKERCVFLLVFLNHLINGVSLGSVYAIIALGYTMVYGIAKMLNFAHGDVIMVGAYVCFFAVSSYNLPPLAGVALAAAVCTALGILIERLAYKPLRQASSLAVLITAIGVSYLLQK